jgi:hypothetical protein
MVTRPSGKHPLSYHEAARRAGVSTTVPLGVRPVRIKRIVGSAGKAEQIGEDFLPLGHGPARGNFLDVLRAMKSGKELPPITVYQLGNRFFVIDGHTRVAAARELGIDFLDAEVIEALPRKEGEANLTHWARREFERYTGLEGVRLTAAWRYHLLHHHVDGYRLYLERSTGRLVSLPEAARIWYRTQFVPTLQEIRRRKLTSTTGGRTAGDVYTDVLRRWSEQEALGVSLREMLDKYDQETERSTVQRAVRTVTRVVDATLPKAVPALGLPTPSTLAAEDIDAELQAPGPGTPAESEAVDGKFGAT